MGSLAEIAASIDCMRAGIVPSPAAESQGNPGSRQCDPMNWDDLCIIADAARIMIDCARAISSLGLDERIPGSGTAMLSL
jgi:hypothetical protein